MTENKIKPFASRRGHARMNEKGEFHFTPEQAGSKPGSPKKIFEGKDYSLRESRRFFQVLVNIPKSGDVFEMLTRFSNAFTNAIVQLKKYLNNVEI